MPTRAVRTMLVRTLAAALLSVWSLLRAFAPAYGSDEGEITWSIFVEPPEPVAGDTITVTMHAGGADSPFMFPYVQVEQDQDTPTIGLVGVEGGWGATITLDAIAPGTAIVRATGFFEKAACPTPGSDFCFPKGFYLTTPDIVIDVSPSDCGDANGDGAVNSLDAAWLLQYAAGLIQTLVPPTNLDVNGDAAIDALDATLILQHAAGLVRAPTCA